MGQGNTWEYRKYLKILTSTVVFIGRLRFWIIILQDIT